MATLATGLLTLAEASKLYSPNGQMTDIAILTSQENDWTEDAIFLEANGVFSHYCGVSTGLPPTYWRAMNTGTPSGTDTNVQLNEPMAQQTSRSQIDVDLIDPMPNPARARQGRDAAHREAMAQGMADTLFNGNITTNPNQFVGLGVRYSSTTAGNGANILLAGGSGADNASLYFVGWKENAIYMTFPKGSQAGLQMQDKGVENVLDANGNTYYAYVSMFKWSAALIVQDWRYVVRVAKIDVSDWLGVTGTQALTASTNLMKLAVRGLARIPNTNGMRGAWYCNRTVQSGFMVQALDRSQNAVAIQPAITQFGQRVNQLTFMGYPIRTIDKLSDAETLVA